MAGGATYFVLALSAGWLLIAGGVIEVVGDKQTKVETVERHTSIVAHVLNLMPLFFWSRCVPLINRFLHYDLPRPREQDAASFRRPPSPCSIAPPVSHLSP